MIKTEDPHSGPTKRRKYGYIVDIAHCQGSSGMTKGMNSRNEGIYSTPCL
jgi:hypothetical protein